MAKLFFSVTEYSEKRVLMFVIYITQCTRVIIHYLDNPLSH